MNIATQAQSYFTSLLSDKATAKWVEKVLSHTLPLAVTVILVLLLASNAAELTWRFVPVPAADPTAPARIERQQAPANGRPEQGDHLAQVADLHLFGVAGARPVAQIEAKAPPTRLNLTLHGVFVEEDPEKGAAIIGTSGNAQKYYQAGAVVMNGVKLQGVFTDRVVLLHNGQSEVLRFPKVSSSGSKSVAALPASSIATRSTMRGTPTVGAASLGEYREIFQKEPLKVFEHVRFVPVRSRDGLMGYRVLPQKNRELYNRLGIRPSDLVTSVNGVDLTNDREAMKLIEMLKEATSIQVEIVRNGQPQSLSFNLN